MHVHSLRGTIHMRRAWLDAWTIGCPRHDCVLGRFGGFECKDSAGRITNFPTRFGREPTDEGQVRDNPVVREVPLPRIQLADTGRSGNGRGVKRWFDSEMLDSVVGRDLMVMAGSDYPCVLYRELFGCDQSSKQVWHDTDNQALQWPDIHHPLGTIGMRIPVAYLAALIWNCLYQRPESAAYADRVVQSVREFLTLRWLREPERRFAYRGLVTRSLARDVWEIVRVTSMGTVTVRRIEPVESSSRLGGPGHQWPNLDINF